jgi:hypothetical protein
MHEYAKTVLPIYQARLIEQADQLCDAALAGIAAAEKPLVTQQEQDAYARGCIPKDRT